jgi:hypothetical protein
MDWIYVAQDTDLWRVLVNTEVNFFRVPENLVTSLLAKQLLVSEGAIGMNELVSYFVS